METNYQFNSQILKENQSDSSNLVLLYNQLLKNNQTLGVEKINSKEINSIIILSKANIITSRIYFEKKFPVCNFPCKDICKPPRKVTINFYLKSF